MKLESPPPLEIALPDVITLEWLARDFSDRHLDDMCTAPGYAQWMTWSAQDGMWLQNDAVAENHAGDYVYEVIRCLKQRPKTAKAQSVVGSMVLQILRRARSILQVPDAIFNSNPTKLNTPGGTVDLATGATGQHNFLDYITRQTAVSPDGECPLWINFLEDITEKNHELMTFLQRMIGYSLTGSTDEQCLFFLYGSGQNGKGVFVHTLCNILKDYAISSSAETFSASMFERHREELARLRGARMVAINETQQNKAWNEQRIKELTGGDTITANFMRRDSFEFKPVCKMLISGNHAPNLGSSDKSIRRRLNLVPFGVEIPDERRDKNLENKLRPEWPGILQWAIDGARDWFKSGLATPPIIVEATDEYIANQDVFGQWLADNTKKRRSHNIQTSIALLYADWRVYSTDAGELTNSKKWFSSEMKRRGYKWHRGYERVFLGIELNAVPQEDRHDPRGRDWP